MWLFGIFPDFSQKKKISGFGWTGELWLDGIFLILRNEEDFFLIFAEIYFFENFGFLKRKKMRFFRFSEFLIIFEIFGIFLVLYWFTDFFWIFFGIFGFLAFFLIYIFFWVLEIIGFILDFFGFLLDFWTFFKASKVTTKSYWCYYWTQKMA